MKNINLDWDENIPDIERDRLRRIFSNILLKMLYWHSLLRINAGSDNDFIVFMNGKWEYVNNEIGKAQLVCTSNLVDGQGQPAFIPFYLRMERKALREFIENNSVDYSKVEVVASNPLFETITIDMFLEGIFPSLTVNDVTKNVFRLVQSVRVAIDSHKNVKVIGATELKDSFSTVRNIIESWF